MTSRGLGPWMEHDGTNLRIPDAFCVNCSESATLGAGYLPQAPKFHVPHRLLEIVAALLPAIPLSFRLGVLGPLPELGAPVVQSSPIFDHLGE